MLKSTGVGGLGTVKMLRGLRAQLTKLLSIYFQAGVTKLLDCNIRSCL